MQQSWVSFFSLFLPQLVKRYQFPVNLLTILYGIALGWASPMMLLFQSEESPVGLMTTAQISLIVSLLCVGAIAGTIIFGLCSDIWGRKVMLLLCGVPQLAANLLLMFGNHQYHVFTARLLLGLASGGTFILVPMFVSEISHER